jgi:PRTRC genetic system ThiF family protein
VFALDPTFGRNAPLSVALVGVGGTGGEVLSKLVHLHHGLIAFGWKGLNVVAFDPDTVAPANIARQRFFPSDVGCNKAITLVNRVNLTCGFGWEAVPQRFGGLYAKYNWDFVISAVDSRKSRRQIHKAAFADRMGCWKFWLDLGNDVTTGQAILGTPRPRRSKLVHSLPCATEMHPDLMDVSLPDDTTPSCSALEAIEKQDLLVNSMVATLGVDLLWQILRHREIAIHARYFNLRNSTLSAARVAAKPSRRRLAAA